MLGCLEAGVGRQHNSSLASEINGIGRKAVSVVCHQPMGFTSPGNFKQHSSFQASQHPSFPTSVFCH